MAQTPPIILDGILTYLRDGSPVQVVVDSSDWYTWLQTASTFTFQSERGSFTARKERAGNQRGRLYWRGYRTRNGKLHRAYLGQSEELTLERLKVIAALLAGQDAGGGSLKGQEHRTGTGVSPRASSSTAHRPHLRAPAANSVKVRPSFADLPAPFTALIGREQDQAAVYRLLCQPGVRLVTLTGTGGVGKTRLGLQVATELREEFADGVHFISLAPISDPNLVIPTIAGSLDIKETGTQSLLDLLKASLYNKHLLLVLDNFEQILPAARQLTDLLASCPQLKIMVTSRAALHLSGEHEFAVAPLPVPDLTQSPILADLAQVETVRLFVERAQAIKADFALTEVNARAIAEICVRLDGLPLAIELAAARIKLLPPQALLKRLEHRFSVLTGGAQNVPTRQQTLRNTIAWSYDLLDAAEQHLFRHLSVFVGGSTLEAIEAVCAALPDGVGQVLEGVSSLLDKSLLQQSEHETGEPRLSMLETLREYGLECLRASGEAEAIQHAQADYYLRLAEEAGPQLKAAGQLVWLARLAQEQENLRAALGWLIEQGEGELALRLVGALWWFWFMHGDWSEGRRWLEAALQLLSAQEPTAARAIALSGAGELAWPLGDYLAAQRLLSESVTLARELGDERGLAGSLGILGLVLQEQGELAAGRSHVEEGLALCRRLDRTWDLARAAAQCRTHCAEAGELLASSGALSGRAPTRTGTGRPVPHRLWTDLFGSRCVSAGRPGAGSSSVRRRASPSPANWVTSASSLMD